MDYTLPIGIYYGIIVLPSVSIFRKQQIGNLKISFIADVIKH